MRRRISKALELFIVGALVTKAAAAPPAGTVLPGEILTPFILENCVRCHGPKKQKGKLRLDTLPREINDNTTARRWQDVLDALNAGDMPPEDEEQPANDELTRVLSALTEGLQAARRQLSVQGRDITMRRLNRREYANSIHALFGFTLKPGTLPEDDPTDSFDTIGSQQYFSSYHFDKYLTLGREVVRAGFHWGAKGRRKAFVNVSEPETQANKHLRQGLEKRMKRWREVVDGLEAGKTWKDLDFTDGRELHYYLNFHAERAGRPRSYLAQELVATGVYLWNGGMPAPTINRGFDPRASYKIRILAGIAKHPPEARKFCHIEASDDTVAYLKVRGTAHQPEMLEFSFTPPFGTDVFQIRVREKRNRMIDWKSYRRFVDPYGDPASLWVDRLEVEGPLYGEVSLFERLLFPDAAPNPNKEIERTDEDAKAVLETFSFEVFRRIKPDPDYLAKLQALYQQGRAAGLDVESALVDPLAVVLASPGFLYLSEDGGDEEPGKKRLSGRELAVRLACFLWSAPPDAALYACAADGSLLRPDVLATQVDRMLADPRSWSFVEGFMGQWLSLQRFDNIVVNPHQYTRFDGGVRRSARREPLHLFQTLLDENLALTALIDSDFVVIDNVLAHHYGIEGVEGEAFRKVSLAADSKRGGLLGTTAFLTMGATGDRTSPIIRGALVMEKLMNDKPAPPPPNVPELVEASPTPVSVREAIQLHQRKPQCASCHAKFDPIGLGLENFDAIGLWRDTETVGDGEVPIETSGALPDRQEYRDFEDLKAKLMGHKDQLARSLVEGVMAYGLGRSVEFSDGDDIAALLTKLREDGYRARALVHGLVQSQLFQRR
jgi:hypothetical protein